MRADGESHGVAPAQTHVMTRLLGVHIAHGLSSETRVFAALLAERDALYEPCVLMHEDDGATGDIDRFVALAGTPVTTIDTGWRPNRTGRRLTPERARVVLQYLSRIDSSVAIGERIDPDIIYSSQQHYDCRTATGTRPARRPADHPPPLHHRAVAAAHGHPTPPHRRPRHRGQRLHPA